MEERILGLTCLLERTQFRKRQEEEVCRIRTGVAMKSSTPSHAHDLPVCDVLEDTQTLSNP